MKILRSSLTLALTFFAATAASHAAESRSDLNQLLENAKGWLLNYQSDSEKAIPAEVFQKAEGVFFCKMVGGSFIIGAQGGEGFGMVRKDGEWSPPAFYNVGSGSIGAQIGGGETTILMFLMNAEGMKILNSDETNWGGTAKAVGGPSSASASDSFSSDTTAKQNSVIGSADIFYYVTASGLEASAAFKGSQCSYDAESTDTYYAKDALTRQAVYDSKVPMTEQIKDFVQLLNQCAEGNAQ